MALMSVTWCLIIFLGLLATRTSAATPYTVSVVANHFSWAENLAFANGSAWVTDLKQGHLVRIDTSLAANGTRLYQKTVWVSGFERMLVRTCCTVSPYDRSADYVPCVRGWQSTPPNRVLFTAWLTLWLARTL